MMGSLSVPGAAERLVLVLVALGLSVLAGAFAAEVDFVWLAAILGVLLAVAMVFSREATLWFIVFGGLVLVGLGLMYVPGAGPFKYIPPLAAAALTAHTVSDWLQHPSRPVPSTVKWLFAFVAVSVLAMAAHWEGFGMAAVGLKSYYPMWTLFLALAMIRWRPAVIDSLPKVALWIALLQLPFVAHQFLVLVPMRQNMGGGVVAVDIVAGTFGGHVTGGGANAVLTVFMIIVSACLLGLWRQRAISGAAALGGVVLLMTPVLLNSARAALLYLPLVFVIVFAGDIVRRPLRAIAGFGVAAALVAGMLLSYTALSQAPGTYSWQDMVRQTYENQLASERERGHDFSSFSRWTVLTFWAGEQRPGAPMEFLIGHGPGASQVEEEGLNLADTLAERRYGSREIGYTAVAALLWDVGVVGLAVVLGLFWAGWRQARRLLDYHDGRDPVRAGIAQGLSAGMVVLVLSLFHKDFFAYHIPYQTMVACVFGYLAAQMQRLEAADRDQLPGYRQFPRSMPAVHE